MSENSPRERCGFTIQRGESFLIGRTAPYRISKDGQSNIVGAKFFEELDAGADGDFEAVMTTVLLPDCPHPFMVDDDD